MFSGYVCDEGSISTVIVCLGTNQSQLNFYLVKDTEQLILQSLRNTVCLLQQLI